MFFGDLFKFDLKSKKKYLYGAILAILLLLLSFFVGRYTTPETIKVEERVVTKEVIREVVVKEQVVKVDERYESLVKEFTAYKWKVQQDKYKNTKTTTVTHTNPDGSSTSTKVSESNSGSKTTSGGESNTSTSKEDKVATNTSVSSKEKIDKVSEKTEEKSKITEKTKVLPPWRATALVGYGVPTLWNNTAPNFIPGLPGGMVVGLSLEKKLFGPVATGIWVNSRLDGGVQLSVSF